MSTTTATAAKRKSRRYQGKRFVTPASYFFRLVLPEQPRWPEQQDRDQDHERDRVAIVAQGARAEERFDDADEQSADDGARDVADAAEDCGDEGLEAGHDAHQRVDFRVQQAPENARDAGQCRAEDE